MITKKARKSKTMKFLESLAGGPLGLPEFLMSIREGDKLSYQEFASKLGISRSHLCDIEKGRKAVSLGRAIEFAEILGYSKDQFARLALQTQINDAGLPFRVRIEAA